MEQTNRTILFEEINPKLNNILTYIDSDSSRSLSDNVLKIIQENLEFSSFDEFLDRMKPSICLYMNADKKTIHCTLNDSCEEKDNIDNNEETHNIYFDHHNLLLEYYLRIISGNVRNSDNVDMKEQILELICPTVDKIAFREKHTNIMSLLAANKEKEAVSELNLFCEEYNNTLILLPIIIEYIEDEIQRQRKCDDITKISVQDCKDTQIEICRVSENFRKRPVRLNIHTIVSYKKLLKEHLQGKKSILKDFFMIAVYGYEKDEEYLVNLHEQYLNYYQAVIDNFWSKCCPLLEKILGVYAFFAQYTLEDEGMKPKLLITNTLIHDIVDAKNKVKLDAYLNSTNEKNNFENTIWYAIIPRMEYKSEEYKENIRVRFRGNDKKTFAEVNSIAEIHALIDILAQYNVQSFVSPVNVKNTTAEWVLKKGIQGWIDCQQEILQKEYAEYIYPCFPNFSIYKDSYMEAKIGGKYLESECRKQWIRMIGIEASYVAAGIFAAIQCPNFLKYNFKKKIAMNYPGVGFRILENNCYLKLPTTLKAGIFMYPQDILNEIERKCYGIFFAPYGNSTIIVQDRAMTGNHEIRDNVSIIQTVTYIERKVRYETQDYKLSLIEQFFKRRPNSLLVDWSNNSMYYNSILKQGENINYTLDEENNKCVLEIIFNEQKYQRTVQLNQ